MTVDPLEAVREAMKKPYKGHSVKGTRTRDPRVIACFIRWWNGEVTQAQIAKELGLSDSYTRVLLQRVRAAAEKVTS